MGLAMGRKVAQTELNPQEYSALAATAKKNKLTNQGSVAESGSAVGPGELGNKA